MNQIELLFTFYYIIFYHIIYIILIKSYSYIKEYYNVILNPLLWCLSIIAIWIISNSVYANRNFFFILSFYLITTLSITMINRENKYFFILGIMVSLFQSEFWELPIYFYKYIISPFPIIITSNLMIFSISTIVKLFIIYEIILIFKRLGFNYLKMINILLIFLLPYTILVVTYYKSHFIHNTYFHEYNLFIFRLLCSLLFFIVIYKENSLIYGNQHHKMVIQWQ